MKIADKFTSVRLFFAPVFFLLYMIPIWTGHFSFLSACIMLPLLGFAEFTDFLDGYFARKNHEVSDFGKVFDPFADVVLHLTCLICCVQSLYINIVFVVLIFYREFGMLFIRLIASGKGTAIAARKGGKFKTVLYIVTILFCISLESLKRFGIVLSFSYVEFIPNILCCLCVVASYLSFFDYLVHFKKLLKNN